MSISCIEDSAMKSILIGLIALPALLSAQDDGKPIVIGGFENTGSVTTGYRFTDVSGYRPKYQQLFDLNSGFRLLDFDLFGKAQGTGSRFADSYSLTLSGLGGEPFSGGQLTVRKNKVYDLRVNYRQSRYYFNQNDAAPLPNGLDGLTNNHNWATVRKMGSVSLLVHTSENLRFSFEAYANTRDGVTETTRSLDYFGSSSTWGSFARANPYTMIAPVSETTDRVTGGVDYTRGGWAFHYKVGYQWFQDAVNGINSATPERSINIDDPTTAAELLNGASWADSRKLTTPVSEFSYTGKLTKRLQARGGYLFYRYQGPATLDTSYNGIARTNSGGTADAPFLVALSTQTNVTEPNQVVEQGFTYEIREWWNVLLDYRYSRFTMDSSAQFRSVNGTTVVTGLSTSQWKVGTHTLDFDTAFTPTASLVVRAGVRLLKEDVEQLADGVVDPDTTKRIKTAWPIASLYYQPSKMLTIRGDVEEINIGTSYTAITPHTDIGGRYSVRFRPTEKFYLEDSGVVRNRTLLQTSFHNDIRSNAASANFEVNDRVTVFAGFSYDSLFAAGVTNFLRGTAPITGVTLRDQTVDRVWQAGIKATLTKRLGVNLTGNYVRAAGLAEIQGETPLYGPMKFPYMTGSIYYDFPQFGRLAMQLQRTYYVEQIVTGNNFGAKLLLLSWTRAF
jgi:hypothetical protein